MLNQKVESLESGKMEKIQNQNKNFPKAVPFILSNVFFERFCSGGTFAILALYINQKLEFDPNESTALFHVLEFVLYFCSIVGAIVADSWLGLFKTISCMALLMSIGTAVVAVVSVDVLMLPIKLLSFVGLFTIVIGSGGIKSNQNVFGGNQFTLPGDGNLLNSYFSMQYFILKCGLLSGQILVPIFRKDVQCFGMDDCYPLAFTVPSILMLLSFLILLAGKSVCIHEPPNENMFLRVCRCILNGMKQKVAQRNVTKKDHWLDYAEEKYGAKLVMETKMVLNVLTLFLPLPIFWALLAQVNSRWVFQATKMNGDIGSYTIQPDQMGMVTSIFIIVLIPIFDQLVYPVLAKVGIKSPLHKITCGFICSSLAFVVAAIVEWNIEDNYINILWLLPQYFIIAMAEVLLWIAVLNFIFTQAPDSMKSVLTAFVYSTVAGGSLIVIIISGANFFNSQFIEYLFYIGLMIFNTFFFLMLSKRYKFVDGTK